MGKYSSGFVRRLGSTLLAVGLLINGALRPAQGCTIFVLTDGDRTLFFNNEDWSNPVSRIWFVPAPEGFHSSAYVGFANNGAEGGMNSAGLAFDWVAGFTETWKPYKSMQPVGGRTSERMLEMCATVEEAIAFYEKYREPQFHRAKILVADKSGASAIIGARDGRLQVDRANYSRGFGYGRRTLDTMLKTNTEPRLELGREILRACEQNGQYATKYSSIFDLKKGEITLLAAGGEEAVKLDLAEELRRGPHYYDIPKIREQLGAEPKPSLSNMRRFLREYSAAETTDSKTTESVMSVIRRCAAGKMRRADFTPEFWKQLEPMKEEIRTDLKAFGDLKGAIFVGPSEMDRQRGFRYKLEFRNAWVLEDFVFNADGKLSAVQVYGVEWKHPLPQ